MDMKESMRPYHIIYKEMFPLKKIVLEGEVIKHQNWLGREMDKCELADFVKEAEKQYAC